jgi:quinol monooxygenase YgiN
MPNMIVVTGRVRIAPADRERFADVASEMCEHSRADDGCRGYRLYASLEEDDRYIIVEEWADDDALQSHFGQPHTAKFMGALLPMLAEPNDAVFHTVSESRVLDPARGLVPLG